MLQINPKLYKITLGTIVLAYFLSFLSFYSTALNAITFSLFIGITLVLTWRNLSYGILILIGEILISSHGHLFDINIYGFNLSLRMALFASVFFIWCVRTIFIAKFRLAIRKSIAKLLTDYFWYLALAVALIYGIINGLTSGNRLDYLYQDANAFGFFLLLPAFLAAARYKKNEIAIMSVWAAGLTGQFLITTSLFFLYGHLDIFWRFLVPFYHWFRDQRLIEVGLYKYSFYRIFMQSQLWALIGFFMFLSAWLFKNERKTFWNKLIACFRRHPKNATTRPSETNFFWLLTSTATILLLSLSRSFWLAGFVTLIIAAIHYKKLLHPSWQSVKQTIRSLMLVGLSSIAIITALLIFPIGQVPGLRSLISLPERITQTDEPALSSRWELLPPLWEKIRSHFIFGRGFGATVTYRTADPRYLEAHPGNPYYTTFAFEWGWLDIWYKIGLIGMLTYLALIANVLMRGVILIKKNLASTAEVAAQAWLPFGLILGLSALVVVQFFTPFLNHPLGIVYLMLADSLLHRRNDYLG
ncbi:MAG: hypothetical protein A2445_05155 [Candidatus Jacksonbacteria bacterium RIFOXYC2_FULL_44_29]|nr:MAG: hypothetical protein UW45_C0014G0015 [Parcubacteria group bacterium GW2011_GWC2_44_22]OGY75732.1 MAG: hypothetical protein A2240_06300 [Candidatus Jacksonbacteria bacterium RIFOXYA2_FULL_43_12]OGY76298.1 MAG: hypothetical protein A2295_00785 [Candidatus Jacksonbacteria bacterium RIFOXYB2_FULL_44_15]OGY78124.1 MAG: hypothetical protein A2445_05155 [Candidatus Jacksonbacteria bacterium RIFOXYC2_FULL_44_29]OGY80967.1 MAG: hypothetical protein A2550_02890 [Candidatus Jacksonbacteria bacteri